MSRQKKHAPDAMKARDEEHRALGWAANGRRRAQASAGMKIRNYKLETTGVMKMKIKCEKAPDPRPVQSRTLGGRLLNRSKKR